MNTKTLVLKIFSSLVVPIIAGVTIFILTLYLPDSLHIIKISSFGYFFAALSTALFLFEEVKHIRYYARLSLFASVVFWIILFFNVFYLYHIPTALTVSLIIFYTAVSITLSIFIGRQRPMVYFWVTVSVFVGGFFGYLTFVTMVYSHRLYSILLFASATFLLAMVFYYMIDIKKYHFRHSKVIRYFLMIIFQSLLSASTILMIS